MRTLQIKYRAKDGLGKYRSGIIQAENRKSAVEMLARQNFYVLSLRPAEKTRTKFNLEIDIGRVKVKDLMVLTRQLLTMFTAGLPILVCFNVLAEQTLAKRLKKAVKEIRADLEKGLALWYAAAKHPKIFPPVYVNMLKAGETGGMLEQILARLSNYLESEHKFQSRIKSASIYPIIVTIFALLVTVFILLFILPTFATLYKHSHIELPLLTSILLEIAVFIKVRFFPIIISLIAAAILLKLGGKSIRGRVCFDRLYLKLPIIGKIIRRITIARFTSTLSVLIQSGIPILDAFEVVEGVIGNSVIAQRINEARVSISKGSPITAPLEDTSLFEPIFMQMIAIGEETGKLDEVLFLISQHYENEAMYTIEVLVSLIEPFLILVVGILIGGLVLAMLLPMFNLISQGTF